MKNCVSLLPALLLGILVAAGCQGMASFEFACYQVAEGLVANTFYDATVGNDGTVWFGTRDGVSGFDGKNWRTLTSAYGLIYDHVYDIFIDSSGTMWLTTVVGISSPIAESSDGSMWFGTWAGVPQFDGHSWRTYTTRDGLACDFTHLVALAQDGTLGWALAMQAWLGFPAVMEEAGRPLVNPIGLMMTG